MLLPAWAEWIRPFVLIVLAGGTCLVAKWFLVTRPSREMQSRFREGRCMNCGYDLRVDPQGRCPECGQFM